MDLKKFLELYPLCENERIDEVNDNVKLIQKTNGLTFGTDALLLAGFMNGGIRRALEIGGGTGIISLLALTRGKIESVDCCEVQKDFADIIQRNAILNGLEERLTVQSTDVRELTTKKQYDAVFTNPPYMKNTSGKRNISEAKNVARHEVFGGIDDFCKAAARLLKFGGRFYAVYRPDRLADLIFAMKACGIEPKRLTFVHADVYSEPSMVLTEGRMGGGVGAKLTRPLIIYKDKEHRQESDDMEYIMENGSFPYDFSFAQVRGARKDGK